MTTSDVPTVVLYSTIHNHESENPSAKYSYISQNPGSMDTPKLYEVDPQNPENGEKVVNSSTVKSFSDKMKKTNCNVVGDDTNDKVPTLNSQIIEKHNLKTRHGQFFCPHCGEKNKSPLYFEGHSKICELKKVIEVSEIVMKFSKFCEINHCLV